jgi:polar amino acid transport system substrate-binding protein
MAALVAALVLLAACGKKEPPPRRRPVASAPAPPAPAPAKVYVVGTDAAYAPSSRRTRRARSSASTSKWCKAVAKKAGIEVKFVNTPWEGIFNALGQGDRDMMVSAVTITDERKQTMDFSNPYFDAQQLIAVKEDQQGRQVRRPEEAQGGRADRHHRRRGRDQAARQDQHQHQALRVTPLALKELESGGVDAVVADNGVVIHYVANNPGGKFKTVTDKEFVPEQYGIAVKKGNTELQEKLNKGLADIQADGTYDQIYTKYFGAPRLRPRAPQPPPPPLRSKPDAEPWTCAGRSSPATGRCS